MTGLAARAWLAEGPGAHWRACLTLDGQADGLSRFLDRFERNTLLRIADDGATQRFAVVGKNAQLAATLLRAALLLTENNIIHRRGLHPQRSAPQGLRSAGSKQQA